MSNMLTSSWNSVSLNRDLQIIIQLHPQPLYPHRYTNAYGRKPAVTRRSKLTCHTLSAGKQTHLSRPRMNILFFFELTYSNILCSAFYHCFKFVHGCQRNVLFNAHHTYLGIDCILAPFLTFQQGSVGPACACAYAGSRIVSGPQTLSPFLFSYLTFVGGKGLTA